MMREQSANVDAKCDDAATNEPDDANSSTNQSLSTHACMCTWLHGCRPAAPRLKRQPRRKGSSTAPRPRDARHGPFGPAGGGSSTSRGNAGKCDSLHKAAAAAAEPNCSERALVGADEAAGGGPHAFRSQRLRQLLGPRSRDLKGDRERRLMGPQGRKHVYRRHHCGPLSAVL